MTEVAPPVGRLVENGKDRSLNVVDWSESEVPGMEEPEMLGDDERALEHSRRAVALENRMMYRQRRDAIRRRHEAPLGCAEYGNILSEYGVSHSSSSQSNSEDALSGEDGVTDKVEGWRDL